MVLSLVGLDESSETNEVDQDSMYQAIAETLYEVGDELPTLIVVLGGTKPRLGDSSEVFLRAIAAHKRHRIDWLVLGQQDTGNLDRLRAIRPLNARVIALPFLSTMEVNRYLLSALDTLG